MVVPATASTTDRDSPLSLFSSDDLPTLGLPSSATRRGPVAGAGELRRGRRQRVQDGVQQVARTAAVQRRHRVRLTQAERPQRGGVGLGPLVVDLVDGQDHRPPGPAQHLGHRLLGRGGADRSVDHHQHRVGGHHRAFGLRGDRALQARRRPVPSRRCPPR